MPDTSLIDILVNHGCAVALVAYYFVKDYKFTENLTKTLTMLEQSINNLHDVIVKGGEQDVNNSTKSDKNIRD